MQKPLMSERQEKPTLEMHPFSILPVHLLMSPTPQPAYFFTI
jgi:hypothetical protein